MLRLRGIQAGDYRAASGLLVRALSTQLAPKRFWPALLFDAVPLLEGLSRGPPKFAVAGKGLTHSAGGDVSFLQRPTCTLAPTTRSS